MCTTTREPSRRSSHDPADEPTRYAVVDASGTVSLFPSTRFTTIVSCVKLAIVPRMSRPPECASAAAGRSSISAMALMPFQKFLFISLLECLRVQPLHLFDLGRRDF